MAAPNAGARQRHHAQRDEDNNKSYENREQQSSQQRRRRRRSSCSPECLKKWGWLAITTLVGLGIVIAYNVIAVNKLSLLEESGARCRATKNTNIDYNLRVDRLGFAASGAFGVTVMAYVISNLLMFNHEDITCDENGREDREGRAAWWLYFGSVNIFFGLVFFWHIIVLQLDSSSVFTLGSSILLVDSIFAFASYWLLRKANRNYAYVMLCCGIATVVLSFIGYIYLADDFRALVDCHNSLSKK